MSSAMRGLKRRGRRGQAEAIQQRKPARQRAGVGSVKNIATARRVHRIHGKGGEAPRPGDRRIEPPAAFRAARCHHGTAVGAPQPRDRGGGRLRPRELTGEMAGENQVVRQSQQFGEAPSVVYRLQGPGSNL